jgi:hypothetical protein
MHACQRSRLLLIGDLACFDEALACRDNQDWCRGRIFVFKAKVSLRLYRLRIGFVRAGSGASSLRQRLDEGAGDELTNTSHSSLSNAAGADTIHSSRPDSALSNQDRLLIEGQGNDNIRASSAHARDFQ